MKLDRASEAPVNLRTATGARRVLPSLAPLAVAYAAGGLPFSNLAATTMHGVDLRSVGTGTVSGTGLYRVGGFRSLAVAGCLDVAKGALGAAAGRHRGPLVQAGSASLAIAGHNWSPWLRGAGGRGLAPALGASLMVAPEATVVLALGLGGGRLVGQTGLGCFLAYLGLAPVLALTRGRAGLLDAAAISLPLLAKRALGNSWPPHLERRALVSRLLFDREGGRTGIRPEKIASSCL
jgi:glycerol-3-phosphate acyltransferase PlsY